MRPTRLILASLAWMALAASLTAAEARILKVLPQWLDKAGRTGLSPSLFERDAYQDHLRNNPAEIAGIRFQILTRLPSGGASMRLVVQVRTSERPVDQPVVLTIPVRRGLWGRSWTHVTLDGDAFRDAGNVLGWKVVLEGKDGEEASQQSFLW